MHARSDDISCYGKKKFKTYYSAERNARGLRKSGVARGKKIDVYRCQTCKQWHVGSRLHK